MCERLCRSEVHSPTVCSEEQLITQGLCAAIMSMQLSQFTDRQLKQNGIITKGRCAHVYRDCHDVIDCYPKGSFNPSWQEKV